MPMEQTTQIPSLEVLEAELHRLQRKQRRGRRFAGFLCAVATLLAALVLAAALWMPILQVYGTAMEPLFRPGDILVAVPAEEYRPGDVVAFYHNNTIQVRRIIAGPGTLVQLDSDGRVLVDGTVLDEPYLAGAALGQCDISLPYTVPDGSFFVMGDNRAESVDSRSSIMGCVSEERIIGKIVFRIWPLEDFGLIPES